MRNKLRWPLTCVVFFSLLVIACGGGGGDGDSQNGDNNGTLEIKSLFTAPDPEDSLLSRIEFEPDNAEGIEAIEIYQSTDNSNSERMTTQIYVAGESKPYMFFHDDMGRVERIDAPDGTGVKLDYTDSTVFFNYITPDKQIGAGSVPIEGELKELLDKLANDDTSTSDVWISDTKALSMDDGNDIGDIIVQSTEYPLKYSLGMWAAVTLVNNTENLRGIPVDGANISCPNTKGYSCHLITVRDGGLHEEPNGTAYRDSFVEIVVRKEFILTKDDVFDLRDDCHSQNKKSRDRISNAGLAVSGAGFVALGCSFVPVLNAAFWGGVGAVATTAGFGISNIESDIVPDCNPYADRQAALQMIPDEELEITITPYSHVYDIVSDPIKIKVTPSCMEYGVNCRDYNEYKEYSFTGAVNIDINRALIACDVCPSGFTDSNVHLMQPTASMPEAPEFQAFDEEVGPPSLYWAAPGDENTCGGDDLSEEYVVWYMDNVQCWDAPRVYATHRDTFNLEEDTCNIPGGGINCDIKVEKVEMQSGFSTLEAAQDWFCPQITTEWYHYWCNHRGPRVEIGGGGLYTLQIPCDLTDVPYEYP